MTNKEQYLSYCKNHNREIPLFMQDWYLDIVCKKEWDVLIYSKDNECVAFFPYYIYRKYSFSSVRPAMFSPYQYPVLNKDYLNKHPKILNNNHSLYHFEGEVSEYFASELDKMRLSACFLNTTTDFLSITPFVWHRFSASVRFTYILDLSNEDVFSSFSNTLKKKIRKAERELVITDKQWDLKQIYTVLQTTFIRQKTTIPYSFELFSNIVTTCEKNNLGKLFVCTDNKDNVLSVLFIAWDSECAYSLIGGSNYDNEQRDAGTFTQYASIMYAKQIGKRRYDFEGSMLKGVENFFQQFGTERKIYISLTKYYSKIYRFLKTIKQS